MLEGEGEGKGHHLQGRSGKEIRKEDILGGGGGGFIGVSGRRERKPKPGAKDQSKRVTALRP